MKVFHVLAALVFFAFSLLTTEAQVLYCATGSGHLSGGTNGQLFTVDPATASATLVGDITVNNNPIGITGLAFNPNDGVLYGVTTKKSPNDPMSLGSLCPSSEGPEKIISTSRRWDSR